MSYCTKLADRIREYVINFSDLTIEEKKMFGGLAFMVNGKMCVSVSKNCWMCRFDPILEEKLAEKHGYEPMVMKGKTLKGYCYVLSEGVRTQRIFKHWINLYLKFNERVKSSKNNKNIFI
ncbi:TfoX/Sxy family protein [Aureibaculum conchae]|uniref:TfoX/Sxy family protein n=1 Tax=Aureibaculum sp. 2308TA14-22 TaxID=3108392 RepID=UPI003393163F